MTLLESVLIAIHEQRPDQFAELKKQLCDHSDATKDDDGNILHCTQCGQMDEDEAY